MMSYLYTMSCSLGEMRNEKPCGTRSPPAPGLVTFVAYYKFIMQEIGD